MHAQISFLEGTLSLIHIPLDLYPSLLQPILKILLPPSRDPYSRQRSSSSASITNDEIRYHHHDSHHGSFLNISVTPVECSIVCDAAWAESVFRPALARLPKEQARTVAISGDTYAVLNVYGAGMDAGSRVADLTSPLALAGIPIFFITTYYSDYILVPAKARQSVIKALLAQGFVFSEDDQSQLISSPSASIIHHHHHHHHPYHAQHTPSSSPTQTSSTLSNLQHRTFALLRQHSVTPRIIPGLTLVQCTGTGPVISNGANGATTAVTTPTNPPPTGNGTNRGHHHHHHHHHTPSGASTSSSRRNTPVAPSWVDTADTRLYTALVAALAAQPRFLSVTLAEEDPPSLLMDRALLPVFGSAVLAGGTGTGTGTGGAAGSTGTGVGSEEEEEEEEEEEDYCHVEIDDGRGGGSPAGKGSGTVAGGGGGGSGGLVPIFLDLADLPFEATGIVSGVAGRLVRELGGGGGGGGDGGGGDGGELSYLSTARSGAVILGADVVPRAMGVLGDVLGGEEGEGGE